MQSLQSLTSVPFCMSHSLSVAPALDEAPLSPVDSIESSSCTYIHIIIAGNLLGEKTCKLVEENNFVLTPNKYWQAPKISWRKLKFAAIIMHVEKCQVYLRSCVVLP